MSIQINVPDYILFEDTYLLAMNKPASLMVEPDRNGHPNLLQQVKKYLKATAPKGSVVYAQHLHRLDRPVSGVILFVKQKEVLRNLSEQFAQRQVQKYYQAITENAPVILKGRLDHWHKKEKKKAILSSEPSPHAEPVRLDYMIEHVSENRVQWNIELHSGKFHQIRAQLSAVGCPILGDILYGSVRAYLPDAIALHASKLVFAHPVTNEQMTIVSKNNFNA